MFDMNNLMGKVQEAQQALKKAQDNLVNIKTTGESGAGIVKATVNGKRKILKIEIDEKFINPDDKEMLQDLTVAAVNKALENIEEMISEEMKKSTGGILPSIPGFDLSQMMK